ncbi:type IV secretion system protein [Xanthomonas euvesicatoria]|uniref:type IV secretion system protein n=1 Tax=Xanthomonas euvesicatoria TaxID=456327 RepID=UPI0029556BD9|nr:type IV secretion system protein [Xanthomonas euvesicatoria]WOP50650.1 type IV secretion system protein [Xanthomonas euvesicatoria]WOP50669.1 type IV secretion system protein [Xanthomonas euvesicatoria]
MATSQLTVFSYIFSEFETVLNSYISQKSADIIQTISPVAWTMLAIYFVLWGISNLRGLIDEPITDGLMRLIKLSVIFGIALNVGRYQGNVVDFFMKTPDALSNSLVFGNTTAESGENSTFKTLDNLLNKTIDVANKAYNRMSVLSPGQSVGLAISANLIMFFGLLFTIVAGIMIVIAKVSMSLMLAIGPLFILMAMYKATQTFFDKWLSYVITAMLTLVMVLAVCSLFFGMVDQALGQAANVIDTSPFEAVATIAVMGVACTILLFSAAGIASQLGGGISLPVSQAARSLSGVGMADSVKDAAVRRGSSKLVDVAAAKMTGGASAAISAARGVGTLYRSSNAIQRG